MQDKAKERLRIECVSVKDLYDFACEFIDKSEGQEISPITKRRALSQSKNPCADPDDIALLVAFIGEKCVGYQGLLPVTLRTKAGESKAYWATSLFVMEEYRNKMVAVHLARKAMSLKCDIVLNDFTESAGMVYRTMRFEELGPLPFLRIRVDRLDLPGLPFLVLGKLLRGRAIGQSIAAAGMACSRVLFYGPLKRVYYALMRKKALGKSSKRFTCKEVKQVRKDPVEGGKAPALGFPRDADAVNWTLEYPWVSDREEPTNPPFYFADIYRKFRNITLEVYDQQETYVGYLMLTMQQREYRTTLKLRDYELSSQVDDADLFAIVADLASRYRPDIVELPHILGGAGQIPFESFTRRDDEREYLFRAAAKDSPLATERESIELRLTDGDTAFW